MKPWSAKVQYLRQDLARRAAALDTLLCDLDSGSETLFDSTVVVVDWSEIHSYICGGGPPLSDSLYGLSEDEDRVKGAHQAALTFLFERFPQSLVILPPHVKELLWFVEAAKQFAHLRAVDERLLRDLHDRLAEEDGVRRIRRMHDEWQKQHSGKQPTEDDLRQIFAALEGGDAEALRRLMGQFASMFLLGRWATLDALNCLRRLLDPTSPGGGRLVFLKDFDSQLSELLVQAVHAIDKWQLELRPRPAKPKDLVQNDARALAYLQILNCELHMRHGKQLLFTTRSEDICNAARGRPEWFSCLADRYATIHAGNAPLGSALPPNVVRDWIYFFELGAAWGPPYPELRKRIEHRLDAVRVTLSSLPSDASISQAHQDILEGYLRNDAGLLNNVQALSSAQNAKLGDGRTAQAPDRPLVDFVRFVTNPVEFVRARSELQDEMREVVERINESLPLMPPADKSFRYRPLLPAVLELVSIDRLVEPVLDAELRYILSSLLTIIRNGEHGIVKHSELGRKLGALTAQAAPREPLSWLAQSLHAYVYQAYGKARLLVMRQQRHFPAHAQLIRDLVVADYWLIEERLHKVDEVVDNIVRLPSLANPQALQLAIRCCRVALELEASYEHAEDPGSFRQSLRHGRSCLQQYLEDVRSCYEAAPVSALPERLRFSVLENLVHAGARLTVTDDDPLGDIADLPSSGGTPSRPVDAVQKYADELERECSDSAEADKAPMVDRASRFDTLAYYYFKRACLEGPAVAFGVTSRQRRHLDRAKEHLRAAKRILEAEPGSVAQAYRSRLVAMHWDLIERMTR